MVTFLHRLTSLPSYSPLHKGSQTQPADPPSGYTSAHPSPRLHDNQEHTVATHLPSAGTSSAARIHSVSERNYKQISFNQNPKYVEAVNNRGDLKAKSLPLIYVHSRLP